jgi:hypothetical protein
MTTQPDGLITVRNLHKGPTLFSDQNTNLMVEWQGAGDPQGEDVQQVPKSLINNMAFARSLRRGVLEVVEADEDVANLLAKQASQQDRLEAQRAEQASASLDRSSDEQIQALPCMGPGERAGASCAVMVPINRDKLEQAPPLCARHANLAAQFVLAYDEDSLDDRGRPIPVWLPVTKGEALPNQVV